jgi:hypothetical protein
LGLGKLLCLEDSYILFSLQIVANLSGCAAVNSETLMCCLRGKNEAEMLAINKVGKMAWLGRWQIARCVIGSPHYYEQIT